MNNVFGTATDGFISCDFNLRIIFINPQASEILGQPAAALIGSVLWEIYSSLEDSAFYQALEQAMRLRVPAHLQEFNPELGQWTEVHAYPVESGLGIYLQNITTRKQLEANLQRSCVALENQAQDYRTEIRQISALVESQLVERQQAEEALRTTNAQLSTIFESITDGFCALDADWRYTYVNQRAEQLLNKHQSELLGRKIWEVFPESVDSEFYHQCHEVTRTGKSAQFEHFSRFVNRWFHNSIYPCGTGVTHYFQDITQRKQLEESRIQLLKFLAEASTILGSSLDCETTLIHLARLMVPFLADYCLIHRLEADGRLREVTAVHRDPQQQFLVDQLASYYPTFLQNSNSIAAQVLQRREPLFVSEFTEAVAQSITQDHRVLTLYRQLAPKSVMLVPLTLRGQNLGAMTLMLSASERRYDAADLSLAVDLGQRAAIAIDHAALYQKAQESNRLKDEFLATLSHELRTPLNTILGWAKLLRNRNFAESTLQQGLEIIERKASEQVKLIYDLLSASQLITGTVRLQPTWVDLFLLMQEVVEALQLAAEAKSIRVEHHLESKLQHFWGDRKYLRQVLWNLLANAIKFTPNQGQIEICLSQVETAIKIQISDTGQGIAPNVLPYIFERFRQADGTNTRRYMGLGLGLSLVYHIVELHGGSIEAISAGEGMGATFTVSLPLSKQPSSQSGPNQSGQAIADLLSETARTSGEPISLPLAGLELLIVEDSLDSREVLVAILEQQGAAVTAVTSAREGLAAVLRQPPDLLISDIGMPEEDGYLLIANIRNLSVEQGGAIPAIALTAYSGHEERNRAIAAGFQVYLSKPVDAAALVRTVAEITRPAAEMGDIKL